MSDIDLISSRAIEELRRYISENRHICTLILVDLVFDIRKSTYLLISSGNKMPPLVEAFKVQNAFYIPYSSVKGALRRIGENIAKASAVNITDSLSRILIESHIEPEGRPIIHRAHHVNELRELAREILNKLDGETLTKFIPEDSIEEVKNVLERQNVLIDTIEPIFASLCPICRLLGGPGVASRIIINNVKINAESTRRTHIGIDRRTNTVREDFLYILELVKPKELSIRLSVINVRPKTIEAKIFAGMLEFIDKLGLFIGGRKSIGLGRIYLNRTESKARYIDYHELAPEEIREYLINPEKAEPITIEQLISMLR